jgi:hypothetical protein
MRMHLRILLALTALALPAQTGCSFMRLDKINRTQCATDMDCADLEAIQSTGSACRTWQCEPGTVNDISGLYCVQGVRDDDNDGAFPAMCAPTPAEADCDDRVSTTEPMADESCNLVDDNCDGIIDNPFVGIPTELPAAGMAGATSLSASAGNQVSVARFVAGAHVRTGTVRPGGGALTVSDTESALIEGSRGAHVALNEGVLAVFDPADNDPFCLPTAVSCGDGRCSSQEILDANCRGPGQDCVATCGNGVCDTGENSRSCTPDCKPTIAQWIAGTSVKSVCLDPAIYERATLTNSPTGDVLLVWVEDANTRGCGMSREAPIYARMLRTLGAGAAREVTQSTVRLELGTTRDWLGASTVFVEGIGFVVAHINAAGAVELHRIEVVPNLAMVAATSLGDNAATAASEVSLVNAGGTNVVVAYTDGACNEANRVMVQSAAVSASSATWATALALQATATVNHRLPVASRNGTPASTGDDRRGEWAVLYHERNDTYAVRVLPDLSATTAEPVVFTRLILGGRAYLAPLDAAWGFVAPTNVETLVSGSLACMPPM